MPEVTTIQVHKKTVEMLNDVKKEQQVKTYEDAIWALKKKKTPSFYGIFARGKRISRKKLLEGLRDKHDRF